MTLPKAFTPRDPKIDEQFRNIFSLRYKHKLPLRQIGKLTGIPYQTIHQALRPFDNIINKPESLQIYNNSRAEVLSAIEMELLVALADKERIQKASLNNVAYAFNQVHSARRLEQGLSTDNLAVNIESTLSDAITKAKKDGE